MKGKEEKEEEGVIVGREREEVEEEGRGRERRS